jgi:hypothetical protein
MHDDNYKKMYNSIMMAGPCKRLEELSTENISIADCELFSSSSLAQVTFFNKKSRVCHWAWRITMRIFDTR